MDLGLKDKVALITGASKGIGLRTARLFAEEGCKVGICARAEEELRLIEKELRTRGVEVAAVAADVLQPEGAKKFIETCASELGAVDILVNNVGGGGGHNLMESTDEEWRHGFDLNVFQVARLTRLVVPHMRIRGGGAIVNVSSISGWVTALAGTSIYGASKAANIFMTEHLALQLARDHIRVNVVSPGSIWWEGGSWDQAKKQEPATYAEYVREGFPMGRLGKPEELADVIVFVASPRANWINGRHIPVDGLEQPVPFRHHKAW